MGSWGGAFWTWWGAFVLLAMDLTILRVVASPSYRRRAFAGGRSPLGIVVMAPGAAVAVALGVAGVDPQPWTALAFLVPLIAFGQVRRRRVQQLPADDLAPSMLRWRKEAVGPSELLRHPVQSYVASFRFLTQMRALAAADRRWERERGLR
jgi:hypothetical protein